MLNPQINTSGKEENLMIKLLNKINKLLIFIVGFLLGFLLSTILLGLRFTGQL